MRTDGHSFSIVQKFVDGEIIDVIESRAASIIQLDAKTSPNRARELAAAQVVRQYRQEYERLGQEATGDSPSDDILRLYGDMAAKEEEDSIQSVVVQLTGTRTLILDVEDLDPLPR